MQASELHSLISKLEQNQHAHYNIVSGQYDSKLHYYFSPPGDEYYNITKELRNNTYVVEYHTSTHIYTLNNEWLGTTASQHNQYRTLLGQANIPVVACETHEEVELDGELWIYNEFSKPYSNAYSSVGSLVFSDIAPSDSLNNYVIGAVSTLNCLASQPTGTKIWPVSWDDAYNISNYFRNKDNEWYWKSPLSYTNRQAINPSEYSQQLIDATKAIIHIGSTNLNPEAFTNTSVFQKYISDLDSSVFTYDLGELS
jgi:hypothetical protein